jgi:hypothetical protein
MGFITVGLLEKLPVSNTFSTVCSARNAFANTAELVKRLPPSFKQQ